MFFLSWAGCYLLESRNMDIRVTGGYKMACDSVAMATSRRQVQEMMSFFEL